MHQMTAKVRSIQGPEPLPNGGTKFYVTLDTGASVVTFSKNAQKALLQNLDQDISFELEAPPDPTTTPRIEKATLVVGGAVLYDRAAAAARAAGFVPNQPAGSGPQVPSGNGSSSAPYYQDETTRAVEFAFGYLTAWNAATIRAGNEPIPIELFAAKLVDLSAMAHEQILALRKPHPTVAALKAEAEKQLASSPWT